MSQNDSIRLLDRWRSGDEDAARELFERYATRLLALARSKISARLRRRVEPEDVIQSACRSFFIRTREDQYSVRESGQVWQLLAAITVSKVRGQVEYHLAKKRAVDREVPVDAPLASRTLEWVGAERFVDDPSDDDAEAAIDELLWVTERLDPLARQVFEERVQGKSHEEISETVGRSLRTVRRVLAEVRGMLEERLVATVKP